ncbi:hypothetical protein [Botrimarina hoheduenensis]|uniref:hypothetical protein n=1 Tax=Botrimarina hoheduenensis TaxID=2528000 RepID=UPI0018D3E141|nr:hypothetical protein [Botrimarina hoheduenensis]
MLTDNGPTGDALEADFQATGDSQGRVTHVSGVLRVRLGEGGPPLGGKNDTHCRRAIGSLSDSIAHELKNVLHVVRGYTSFAYQGVDPDTPLGDDLFQALAATDRAADIATRLLRFSRAEDDPNELLDLNEIVSDLSALVRPIFEPEIEMSVAIAAQPLPIIGMNATARMALLNLCVHLRESLGEGRRFVLRCDRMPNASDLVGSAGNPPSMGAYARILLAVEDHAGEAAIRNESALYERISQVEIESAKAALPLAIAQNIVNRVGGSLERLAKREGGTAYRVWLPLSKVALKRNSIGVAVPTTALPFSMAEEV